MASAMAYAKMSDAAYSDSPGVEGWTLTRFKSSGPGLWDAFQGAAFSAGGEVVFAFKGTSLKRDAVADFKLGVGMNTTHYADAAQFVNSVPTTGKKVSLCGHSLGGAIAQVVGNRTRYPFVTFNAPGVALISRNLDEVVGTFLTGSVGLRTLGMVASAVRHPVQAAQDTAAAFHKTRGANLRLSGELVSKLGVHYGRVIEVPALGGMMNPYDLHLMTTMLKALEKSTYVNKELEELIG